MRGAIGSLFFIAFFAGMYDSEDLVIELPELVMIHRLEANSDWGFAAFTLKEAFS